MLSICVRIRMGGACEHTVCVCMHEVIRARVCAHGHSCMCVRVGVCVCCALFFSGATCLHNTTDSNESQANANEAKALGVATAHVLQALSVAATSILYAHSQIPGCCPASCR